MSPTTLRVLKILVVVMGIMIVAGVITIVVTIISRLKDGSKETPPTPVTASPPAVAAPATVEAFGSISHALPAGAQVISVSADAGRLYVHYQLAGGEARVLVLNGATGAELGDVRLKSAP